MSLFTVSYSGLPFGIKDSKGIASKCIFAKNAASALHEFISRDKRLGNAKAWQFKIAEYKNSASLIDFLAYKQNKAC